jgi:hypothetical protein
MENHITPEQREHLRHTRLAEAQRQLDDWDGTGGEWYWISFVDPGPPRKFLGVAIVKAPGDLTACLVARRLGCNPGGEAQFAVIPKIDGVTEELWHPQYTNRLLTRVEVDEFDLKVQAAAETVSQKSVSHG